MLKSTPNKTDRKLKTCSFQHCSRWAKAIAHPRLLDNIGQKLTSKHCVGDWNVLDFFCQMVSEERTQHNDIVFQPVWWKPSAEDSTKLHEQIHRLGWA